MNIGDKVRMLRAKEEGVITGFMPGNLVEIEIEDGFKIPVMRSELVLVSPLEAERLLPRRERITDQQRLITPAVLSNQGIYLAFIAQNDKELAAYLINNTDWELPFTIGEERSSVLSGVLVGVLRPKSEIKLNDYYLFSTLDNWPTFVVQALWFRRGNVAGRSPLIHRIKVRAQTFYNHKATIPVLNKPGHLYQLDSDTKEPTPTAPAVPRPKAISAEELMREMLKPKNETPTPALTFERPSSVVDLHIEALLPAGPGNRTTSELLDFQLKTFEKTLENAIATGMGDITFIHGAGSGKLRDELHRRLGKHPHVRFFEDAQKQKFGYGATKVTIK
jgi:hypothetical protein